MKAIKEFVEMMENQARLEELEYDDCPSQENSWFSGRCALLDRIRGSSEYQALKDGIEQATDTQSNDGWTTGELNMLTSGTSNSQTFDSYSGKATGYCKCTNSSYWNKCTGGGVSFKVVSVCLNCDLPIDPNLTKEKSEKSNDGWIEHDGGSQPVHDDTLLEMRFRYGENQTDYAKGNSRYKTPWIWQNIIAYRIIEEPKYEDNPFDDAKIGEKIEDFLPPPEELKKKQCDCKEPGSFVKVESLNNPVCVKCGERFGTKVEPKKPLSDFLCNRYSPETPTWIKDILDGYSEYLEQNK